MSPRDPRLTASGGGAYAQLFSNDPAINNRVEIAEVKIASFETDRAKPLHVEIAPVYIDGLPAGMASPSQKLVARVVETKNADVFAEKRLQIPAVGLAFNTLAQKISIFIITVDQAPTKSWTFQMASSIAVGNVNRDALTGSWYTESLVPADTDVECPHYASTARIESLHGLATYRWLDWQGAIIATLPSFGPAPALGQVFNVPADARFLRCTSVVGAPNDSQGTIVWGFK